MRVDINILKLNHFDPEFSLPTYETLGAAGADLRASFEDKKSLIIKPFERKLIPTGLKFEIPRGFEVQIRPRSGLSLKSPLVVINSPGTIDSDYRGEVKIIMANLGQEDFEITHGMRVAQMVVASVTQAYFNTVNELSETHRSEAGFGSTGLL